MDRMIEMDRSLIVAADLPNARQVGQLAQDLNGLPIGAYKIGFVSALVDGLSKVCDEICEEAGEETIIIYDHQKAGTDIPEMAEPFAKALWGAGVNAAILFPQAGPVTAETWIKECQDHELHVIVGLAMTHASFLASEGGYIMDDAPSRAFELACKLGVRDFVVPGTKLELVVALRNVLERELGDQEFCLYSPGFISQGGDVTECGKAAGPNFHAIVGGAVYKQRTKEARRQVAMQVINGLA